MSGKRSSYSLRIVRILYTLSSTFIEKLANHVKASSDKHLKPKTINPKIKPGSDKELKSGHIAYYYYYYYYY